MCSRDFASVIGALAFLSSASSDWARCVDPVQPLLSGKRVEQEICVDCICIHISEVPVPSDFAVEGCAAHALSLLGQEPTSSNGADVAYGFHVLWPQADSQGISRCVVERCIITGSGCSSCIRIPDDTPGWRSYARRSLCPNGAGVPAILPEIASLASLETGTGAAEDGVSVRQDIAEQEFLRVFGPGSLRGQELRGFRSECSASAHRLVAKVCLGGAKGCDELSKYSLPRCHVSLTMPYDPGDGGFLYAPACERTGQLYCPPGLPVALQLTLKAGSRSAAVWAAMLEGLLPALVNARRTLAVTFADSGADAGHGRLARYVQEWLEHEEMRLGCAPDLALFSITRALHMLSDEGRVGLPLALCPTCCRTGAGRLRVIFVRSPLARLRSFFHGYWFPSKGHLLPPLRENARGEEDHFETWVELILEVGSGNRTLFEADDLDHVAPAFQTKLHSVDGNPYVIFAVEDVAASMQRVERALCRRPFRHCTPLPKFPAGAGVASKRGPRRPELELSPPVRA
ncbi:unnamed protein product [Polarella glacialis]|uniref:Uncharacterized protein n=1 Tax=Polarella glacialis TaxID=89957 RepID=A0A813HI18_POLGL|nr:unnamed protein product [Polarella glacialis]